MAVKLTDKEVTALAKKVQDKQKKVINTKRETAIKLKLPEAKKIIKQLEGFDDSVLDVLYNCRYSRTTPGQLLRNLAGALVDNGSTQKDEYDEQKTIEADIVIAANGCKDMATLCKVLAI